MVVCLIATTIATITTTIAVIATAIVIAVVIIAIVNYLVAITNIIGYLIVTEQCIKLHLVYTHLVLKSANW